MLTLPNFSILDKRQNLCPTWDVCAQYGGSFLNGGGGPAPIIVVMPPLPEELSIFSYTFYYNVTVLLTASANTLQYSADGVNWVTSGSSLAVAVGTIRNFGAPNTGATFPRYWRFNRTDLVGTITQLIVQFTVNP